MAGVDCSFDCVFPECGNSLYRDGTVLIDVEMEEGGKVRFKQRVRSGTQVGEYSGMLVDTKEYQVLARRAREEKFGAFSAVDY